MRFDIVSAAPEVFASWQTASILGRGQRSAALTIQLWDLREYGLGPHGVIDDYPFGGGTGMVLKPEPLAAAIDAAQAAASEPAPVLLMTPQGQRFTQAVARELAELPRAVVVCGRYEGLDERIRETRVTRELSIGDYVLTGGELAAMVIIEATARLAPGVLGNAESAREESHSEPLLEYPHYTRPAEFDGLAVPEVLRSGHHEQIRLWRRQEQLRRTLERRPDLAAQWRLSDEDRRLLAQIV